MAPGKAQSYADFRNRVMDNYSTFRSGVLADYDRFLEGIWDDYQQLSPISRDITPKPHEAPSFSPDGQSDADIEIADVPIVLPPRRDHNTSPSVGPAIVNKPAKPNVPSTIGKPQVTHVDSKPITVDFYGIKLTLDNADFDIRNTLSSPHDYASQWRELTKAKAEGVLASVKKCANDMGLNDYLTSRLIKAWVDARFAGYEASTRMSLLHYLLAVDGYDTRIAIGGNGKPLLLMACSQMVYGRPYLEVEGTRYIIFGDDESDMGTTGVSVSTCRLPDDEDHGRKFDLRIGPLSLPANPVEYDLSYGPIHISGTVNGYLRDMLYRYPQIPVADYAESCPSPEVRRDIINQVRRDTGDMSQIDAVNALLHFVQSAFVYATDDEAHGFEKPYFFEEMLLQDRCDCEDRSIFYAYLLYNALDANCHIINYPGHESVAVNIDTPLRGTSYTVDDATYYISDPTYIGSSTGQCMRNYRAATPRIDHVYGAE